MTISRPPIAARTASSTTPFGTADHHAIASCQVRVGPDVHEPTIPEQRRHFVALTRADLDDEDALGAKPSRRFIHETPVDIGPPEERQLGIGPYVRRKRVPFLRADVGRVADDQVEASSELWRKRRK